MFISFEKICKVYQCGDDPDHLLLVDDCDMVINGNWPLSYARKNNFPLTLVGEAVYYGDYNEALLSFQKRERMVLIKCECCGNEEWKVK